MDSLSIMIPIITDTSSLTEDNMYISFLTKNLFPPSLMLAWIPVEAANYIFNGMKKMLYSVKKRG